MLAAKKRQAELIQHNLEKGLGNEEALRQLIRVFLPRKFGVAKGKVANARGNLSRQTDVIIYDALDCPSLFVDENQNQILPVERVYGVIEVKTSLDATGMEEAFRNLKTIHDLRERTDASTNSYQWLCPPWLKVFAFDDKRSLRSIARQFDRLSRNPKYRVRRSSWSYSDKSPAFKDHCGQQHLVSAVDVLGKGTVLHMLDDTVHLYEWAEYTLGMFLIQIVEQAESVKLPSLDLSSYLNLFMIEEWRGLKNTKDPISLSAKPRRRPK